MLNLQKFYLILIMIENKHLSQTGEAYCKNRSDKENFKSSAMLRSEETEGIAPPAGAGTVEQVKKCSVVPPAHTPRLIMPPAMLELI